MAFFDPKEFTHKLSSSFRFLSIPSLVEQLKPYINGIGFYFELRKILKNSYSFYLATKDEAERLHLQQNNISVIIDELNLHKTVPQDYVIFFKIYGVLGTKYADLDFFGIKFTDEAQRIDFFQTMQRINGKQQHIDKIPKSREELASQLVKLPWLRELVTIFKRLVSLKMITYTVATGRFEQFELDLNIRSATENVRWKRRAFYEFFMNTVGNETRGFADDWHISSLCNNLSIHVAKEKRHYLEKLQGNFISPMLATIDKKHPPPLPIPPPPLGCGGPGQIPKHTVVNPKNLPSPFDAKKITRIAREITSNPLSLRQDEERYAALVTSNAIFEVRSITVQLLQALYQSLFMYTLCISHKFHQPIFKEEEINQLHPWIQSIYTAQCDKLKMCDLDSLVDAAYTLIDSKLRTKQYYEGCLLDESNAFWPKEINNFWRRFFRL